MKMTKQQLKQIIKEELDGVLKEMGPDPSGLGGIEQSIDAEAPVSRQEQIASLRRQIEELESSFQGLGAVPEQGFRLEAEKYLHGLYQELEKLEGGI